MGYSLLILSVCMYVESRLKTHIDTHDLEMSIGYSYTHIRKTFRDGMQMPISRYILSRKLSCAAFDMIHTEKNLLDIAVDYGFDQYDTFTRAFKRETGVLPSEFRRLRAQAGRRLIASGVYAPAILNYPSSKSNITEVIMNQNADNSCILLGVPKVEYKWEECTPFPSCLKACLNYMGQDISYAYIMAASGAAFRLRFSNKFWDGGNVDICYIYEDDTEAFRRSFEAAGRSYKFLKRNDSDKQGFINFIKAEINDGRPVIALGIIGPPEACIITGYQDDGNTLLGWNFFQHRPECNKGTSFHENGYFISSTWWENECTSLLMSIGEEQNALISDKAILENAISIEDRKPIIWEGYDNEVTCGKQAYETWAKWTADDRQFADSITLPLLNERFMCQTDAQTMVGEGRWYASEYLKMVAKRHPEVEELCMKAVDYFCKASVAASRRMYEVLGNDKNEEVKMRHYAKPETRSKIVELIREADGYEEKAMEIIKTIVNEISE